MSRAKKSRSWGTKHAVFVALGVAMVIVGAYLVFFYNVSHYERAVAAVEAITSTPPAPPTLDKAAYDRKALSVANCPPPKVVPLKNATSGEAATSTVIVQPCDWPVKTVYPNAGALLPFYRIVAYYGNFYSKGMGVLGEYPEDQMISMLDGEVAQWNAADPTTPVVPAIDYIAVTAQGSPIDGKWRARMPDSQMDHALELAEKVHGIVILDVQVGLSTLPQELPLLERYLKLPNVHLAIDPEFSMKTGDHPGDVIGYFTADDVNYAANYLAQLVRAHNLPPKILVVHRFTGPMVKNASAIVPLPEVQIIMDMDGWGPPAKKLNTYEAFIASQPVQFTGFKLFYKNDMKPPSTRLLAPAELLELTPRPLFIQYQ